MMFRIFILLLLVNKSVAQDISIKWSERVTTKGNIFFSSIVDGLLFTAQHKDNSTVHFRTVNDSLNFKNETTMEFGNEANPSSHLLSFVAGGQFMHLQYLFSKKEGQFKISTSSSDLAFNHRTASTPLLTMKASRFSRLRAFYSSDRSKLLLCSDFFVKKTATVNNEFAVLEVRTGEVMFRGVYSYIFGKESPGVIGVDNDGNAYFGLTEYIRVGSKLSGKSKAKEKIFFFSKRGLKKSTHFLLKEDTRKE